MTKRKELGAWYVTRHAINHYKERVIDDPLLKRDHTTASIEGRIRSALNHSDESTMLDIGVSVYKVRFTKRGEYYYVPVKPDERPKQVLSIWTEIIYHNYLDGITSENHSASRQRTNRRKN